jgi:hypothetical protein
MVNYHSTTAEACCLGSTSSINRSHNQAHARTSFYTQLNGFLRDKLSQNGPVTGSQYFADHRHQHHHQHQQSPPQVSSSICR